MTEYILSVSKEQRMIPNGMEIWYSVWELREKDSYVEANLYVPCRSNLHRFLTGLLLNWAWGFEGDLIVTDEEAKFLKIIFENQRDYKYWKKGLEILSKDGQKKAWEWIEETMPLLKLRNKLAGK